MQKPSSGCLSILPTGRLLSVQGTLACGSNKWMSCPQIGRQSHKVLNSYRAYESPLKQKEKEEGNNIQKKAQPPQGMQNQTRSAAA